MSDFAITIPPESIRKLNAYPGASQEVIRMTLQQAAMDVMRESTPKAIIPWVTGSLSRSIHLQAGEGILRDGIGGPYTLPKGTTAVLVGSALSYARKQEYTNRTKSGFLQKGYAHALQALPKIFEEEFEIVMKKL